MRQRARYSGGVSPTRWAKRRASVARDTLTSRASDSIVHGSWGCWWMAFIARATTGSRSASSHPSVASSSCGAQPRSHHVDQHHVDQPSYRGPGAGRAAAELEREQPQRRGDASVVAGHPGRDVQHRRQLGHERVGDLMVVVVRRAEHARPGAGALDDHVAPSVRPPESRQ